MTVQLHVVNRLPAGDDAADLERLRRDGSDSIELAFPKSSTYTSVAPPDVLDVVGSLLPSPSSPLERR